VGVKGFFIYIVPSELFRQDAHKMSDIFGYFYFTALAQKKAAVITEEREKRQLCLVLKGRLLILLHEVADLGEDILSCFLGLFGSGCRLFFLLLFELALYSEHDSEEDEDRERDEDKVDDSLDEETVSEDVCGGYDSLYAVNYFNNSGSELILEVSDVCTACEKTDERHNDVVDERGNDLTECTADNNTDSHVDNVAFCDEGFEICEEFFHCELLFCREAIFSSIYDIII